MSRTPRPRSSVEKRVILRDSASLNKDIPGKENESRARDEELDEEDKNEESKEVESLSQEELQVLDDLHALELVLADLIKRRARGSVPLQTVNASLSRRSSSASDATIDADEKHLLELEDQTIQEDIRGLDSFFGELIDRRAHGKQTPPLDATAASTDAEKATTDVNEPAQLRDSRLSQIVAINEDITNEIKKIDAELRKAGTKGILKTGTGQPSLSEPSSLPASKEVVTRSTSLASEVTEDSENFEPKDEEGILSNLEDVNVPSVSSSVQTLPPSPIEPIIQYNSEFSTASPPYVPSSVDPFIRRAIQRILDLKTVFPDQNLYLIPSSSFPLTGIPHPISSIFKIPLSAQDNSHVTETLTDSSSFPGRTPDAYAPSPDAKSVASVEMEAPFEKAIPKNMEKLNVQTYLDYFSRRRPTAMPTTEADAATPKSLPEVPLIVEVPDNEAIVNDNHFVVPDESKGISEREERRRTTLSLPVEVFGAARQNTRRTRETSPAILLSSFPQDQHESTKHVEVMPDHQSSVKTSATSTKSEVSSTTLKSSLRSAAATQSGMKQMPASKNSSSGTVPPAQLATDPSASIKKKVSFADIPSTMYIIVNPSSEEPEATLRPSVGFEIGWEADKDVAPKTVYDENDMETKSQKSLPSSTHSCAYPRLAISSPSYPITAGVSQSCSNEARRICTETAGNLFPSSHVVTGSITHVMTRARSSGEQGRGSRERWVTRINSRNLSFSSDDALSPSCRSGSLQSNACECLSIQGVSPPPSDVANVLPLNTSCSNCMMNTNCSCSRTRSGKDCEALHPDKEHSTMGSFSEDNDKGGSLSSLGDCSMCASDSENSNVCSVAGTVFNKSARKRTKNTTDK